jgi:hypothetical protein
MIHIDTDTHGPIFDGRASLAARDFVHDSQREISEQGADMIRTQLDHVLRHQTGRYRRSIHVQHGFGSDVINDGGIVYGPWLEGTGSRNRTTRFKGYATFRRVVQRLERQSGNIAERMIPSYLRRMQ